MQDVRRVDLQYHGKPEALRRIGRRIRVRREHLARASDAPGSEDLLAFAFRKRRPLHGLQGVDRLALLGIGRRRLRPPIGQPLVAPRVVVDQVLQSAGQFRGRIEDRNVRRLELRELAAGLGQPALQLARVVGLGLAGRRPDLCPERIEVELLEVLRAVRCLRGCSMLLHYIRPSQVGSISLIALRAASRVASSDDSNSFARWGITGLAVGPIPPITRILCRK